MYRASITHVTFPIFIILNIIIIAVSVKSSSSSSLYNDGQSLNSKIASLIKQSSITINSYGAVGTVGSEGTNCNSQNVQSVLFRVYRGGSEKTTSRTVRNSRSSSTSRGVRDLRGGSMNQTATVMKSRQYDNDFSSLSSPSSSSSNSSDTVVLTTSVSTTATSMNNTLGIDNDIALESSEIDDASESMEEKQVNEVSLRYCLFINRYDYGR